MFPIEALKLFYLMLVQLSNILISNIKNDLFAPVFPVKVDFDSGRVEESNPNYICHSLRCILHFCEGEMDTT